MKISPVAKYRRLTAEGVVFYQCHVCTFNTHNATRMKTHLERSCGENAVRMEVIGETVSRVPTFQPKIVYNLQYLNPWHNSWDTVNQKHTLDEAVEIARESARNGGRLRLVAEIGNGIIGIFDKHNDPLK